MDQYLRDVFDIKPVLCYGELFITFHTGDCMKRIAALIMFIALFCASAGLAAAETEKQKDIRKLLELTNSAQLGIQVMNQMIDQMKGMVKDVPPQFWEDFKKEVNPNEMVNLVVAVYDKYLSQEDVREMIKFYNSPTGRKLISVQGQITMESMTAGQQWGRQIAEKLVKKLQTKGYMKNQ